jgi:hypothetical protein
VVDTEEKEEAKDVEVEEPNGDCIAEEVESGLKPSQMRDAKEGSMS